MRRLRARLTSFVVRRLNGLSRHLQRYAQPEFGPASTKENSSAYLLMPINGAGLGHLTRCLAIAKAIRRKQPNATLVFFTTSIASVLVNRFGFECFHIPPIAQLNSDKVTPRSWNELLASQLQQLLGLYDIDCLIFDGTYTYQGLQEVLRANPQLRSIWVRRAGTAPAQVATVTEQEKLFSLIVAPGELDQAHSNSTEHTRVVDVPPVLLLEQPELLTREEARRQLGVTSAKKLAYVQLGAGNINEIDSVYDQVTSVLAAFEDLQIVTSRSPISLDRPARREGVLQVSDYPNARFFNGFDLAIVAAGYNSVNETVALGLPAIFVPNESTKSDDQTRRAQRAANGREWHCWDGNSGADLHQALETILTLPAERNAASSLNNGARVIADLVVDHAPERILHR